MATQIVSRKTVTDVEQIFSTPPRKVIGNPNTPLVLSDDVLYAVNAVMTKRNRVARVDAEGYPLPLHRTFAMDDDASGYGIPTDDTSGDSFSFSDYLNTH